MCLTCWMIIQRLAERLSWTGCSCHKNLLSFKAFHEILNILMTVCQYLLGACKTGDFSVQSEYDLSNHEPMSSLREAQTITQLNSCGRHCGRLCLGYVEPSLCLIHFGLLF